MWAGALINVEGLVLVAVNAYVDVIVGAEIALEFAVRVLRSSADVVRLADVLVNALPDVMVGVAPVVGVDALAGLDLNMLSVVMTVLKFIMSTLSEEFSR